MLLCNSTHIHRHKTHTHMAGYTLCGNTNDKLSLGQQQCEKIVVYYVMATLKNPGEL